MAAKFSTVKKLSVLICVCSLIAVSFAPNVSQAEESQDSLLMVWAPIAWPTAQANAYDNSTKKSVLCENLLLEELVERRCGPYSLNGVMNTLTPCSVDARVSCIKSLEIKLANEPWQAANYLGPMSPSYQKWESIPSLDLGSSNDSSIFTTTNKSGKVVLWHTTISYLLQTADVKAGATGPSQFEISIKPVRRISVSECVWQTRLESLYLLAGSGPNFRDYCYERLQQPALFNARLVLTLRHEPAGWITSHLQQFGAQIKKYTDGSGRIDLTLEGMNATIPVASLTIANNDADRKAIYCSIDNAALTSQRCNSKNTWLGLYLFNTAGRSGVQAKASFLSLVDKFPELNQSTFDAISWSLLINMKNVDQINSCQLPSGIYGVIGGNAMAIDESIPLWDQATQTLEFGVASPHYRSNGEINRGFYEMQLNKRVAKCLWGTKIIPTNFSLSVVDENGQSRVATATVTVQNEMVIFRATGFMYSSVKLKVSLKKLVCVKNGVSKIQVKTATSCPKGWKKK